MKGILNLVVAVICVYTLVSYFMRPSPGAQTLFGFEVNDIIYLLFWIICLVGSVISFAKANKKAS